MKYYLLLDIITDSDNMNLKCMLCRNLYPHLVYWLQVIHTKRSFANSCCCSLHTTLGLIMIQEQEDSFLCVDRQSTIYTDST